MVGPCRMNGVEPSASVKATLEAIAGGHPASRIDILLPRAFVDRAATAA